MRELTKEEIRSLELAKRGGRLKSALRPIYKMACRVSGRFSVEDQMNIACMLEPPLFFTRFGMMIPHPYGITLSIDEIGCDCSIGQNVTIGTNGRGMKLDDTTDGFKPRIGSIVRIYPGAIISGRIHIGDCSLVAAGAIVTKDVAKKSIVYGTNEVAPLNPEHFQLFEALLHHATIYDTVPGLTYKENKLYIDDDYVLKRNELARYIGKDTFTDVVKALF